MTVFRGLTMSGEATRAPGPVIVSDQRAAARGLVRNEAPDPANIEPDYPGMGALVLARAMTRGPCLISPQASKESGPNAVPTSRGLAGHDPPIVFDLISLLTSHRIPGLPGLCCAPASVDADSNFGPGSSTSLLHADHWTKKELTQAPINQRQERLHAWSRFDTHNRDPLEVAVSRLASSLQRHRGRFWMQERILDGATTLEVMSG